MSSLLSLMATSLAQRVSSWDPSAMLRSLSSVCYHLTAGRPLPAGRLGRQAGVKASGTSCSAWTCHRQPRCAFQDSRDFGLQQTICAIRKSQISNRLLIFCQVWRFGAVWESWRRTVLSPRGVSRVLEPASRGSFGTSNSTPCPSGLRE